VSVRDWLVGWLAVFCFDRQLKDAAGLTVSIIAKAASSSKAGRAAASLYVATRASRSSAAKPWCASFT